MELTNPDVRIVLVRPRNPLNIGAAARAMMNFGFEDLVLVSPHDPVWQEAKSAVGAKELLRRARAVSDLMAAIEDRTLVVGTSSLARRQVSGRVISLQELSGEAKMPPGARVALVFGSEKTGLSRDDLSHCHMVARIPTTPRCPSMNLGQAVAVCCYELCRATERKKDEAATGMAGAASAREIERLIDGVGLLLSGGLKQTYKRRLRAMLLQWPLASEHVTFMLGILRDLSWQLQRKQ